MSDRVHIHRIFALFLPLLAPFSLYANAGEERQEKIEQALVLVRSNHPAVLLKRNALNNSRHEHSWSASLNFGVGVAEAGQQSQQADIGLQLVIPLFDERAKRKQSSARVELVVAEQESISQFLLELKALTTLGGEWAASHEFLQLLEDRLEWQKQAVEQGDAESNTLWSHATEILKARQDRDLKQSQIKGATLQMAHHYGNHQWKRLQALLEEIVR